MSTTNYQLNKAIRKQVNAARFLAGKERREHEERVLLPLLDEAERRGLNGPMIADENRDA